MSETNDTTQENTQAAQSANPYLIPGAVVVAGLFIALAVVMTGGSSTALPAQDKLIELPQAEILPITEEDHVRGPEGAGDPRDADVFLVEYSDYRCSYCGRFHATVLSILDEYEGRVSWVYRHTPYQPGGMEAAVASECIAELAGEDAFWEYTDLALNNQSKLSPEWHLSTAVSLGADEERFKECVSSGRYNERIAAETKNSQEMGGQGTPHNVLLTKEGRILPFPGAQPIEKVREFINVALDTLQ